MIVNIHIGLVTQPGFQLWQINLMSCT